MSAQISDSIRNHYKKHSHGGKTVFFKRKKAPMSQRIWDFFFYEDYHFLRYWPVVQEYYTKKLDITSEDLLFLMYLAPKEIFSIESIQHYPLSKQPKHRTRIKEYIERGFLRKERKSGRNSSTIYQPTPMLNSTIKEIYRKLMLLTKFSRANAPIEMKKFSENEYDIGNMPALFEEFNEAVELASRTLNPDRDRNRERKAEED